MTQRPSSAGRSRPSSAAAAGESFARWRMFAGGLLLAGSLAACEDPTSDATIPLPRTRAEAQDPGLRQACASLVKRGPRSWAAAWVLARHCDPSLRTGRDLRLVMLHARTPAQAHDELQALGAWTPGELRWIVEALLVPADPRPLMSGPSPADEPPSPAALSLLPIDAEDAAMVATWTAIARAPNAPRAQRVRAHAALAAFHLQLFDSLTTRADSRVPPLAAIIAARFLGHADRFARAHLQSRVAGLHPALRSMEPRMAELVAHLARTPLVSAPAEVIEGWYAGWRYLQIKEVQGRLRGRTTEVPWDVVLSRLIELNLIADASRLLGASFPGTPPDVLRPWLEAQRARSLGAPTNASLDPAQLAAIPAALLEFTRRQDEALAERVEILASELSEPERLPGLEAAIRWTRAEATLYEHPRALAALTASARRNEALAPYLDLLTELQARVPHGHSPPASP